MVTIGITILVTSRTTASRNSTQETILPVRRFGGSVGGTRVAQPGCDMVAPIRGDRAGERSGGQARHRGLHSAGANAHVQVHRCSESLTARRPLIHRSSLDKMPDG